MRTPRPAFGVTRDRGALSAREADELVECVVTDKITCLEMAVQDIPHTDLIG